MRMTSAVLLFPVVLTLGCLDDHSGPHDQWMGTDAYVMPEVGVAPSDAGEDAVTTASCSDAGPSFGDRVPLSSNPGELDGGLGQAHAQSDVTLTSTAAGTRRLAWVDRNLALPGVAGLQVIEVSGAGEPGALVDVPLPDTCTALTDPSITTTETGTVLVTAICRVGAEDAPTATDVVVLRSTTAGASFDAPVIAVGCPGDTFRCSTPAIATVGPAVYVAWADQEVTGGTVTAGRVWTTRSDDDGLTFLDSGGVADANATVASPRLAVGPDGTLHVAYAGFATLGGSAYAMYSRLQTDGTFTTGENVGPGSGPAVAAGESGIAVVWGSGGYVYEAHAAANGVFTAPLPIETSLGATQVMPPAVALGTDGRVHVFWVAEMADGWGAVYTRAAALGAAFDAPVPVAGPFDGDPYGLQNPMHRLGAVAVGADAAGVIVAWADPDTLEPTVDTSLVFVALLVCD